MSLTAIRLPDDLGHKLEEVAKHLQRSKSYLIRKAIEEYLDDCVDYEIALGRMRDKNDKIITSEEMKKRLEGKRLEK